MTGTILTAVGKAKIASATPEAQLQITHVAVGDGNGSYPVLTENMVALANEVWRGTASTPIRDTQAPNTLMFESAIPPDVGGFTIREIGIFDVDGDMIAIGHVDPAQVKPLPTTTTAVNMTVRMIIALANAEQTNLVLSVAPVVTHNGLADRDMAGAHPASAIVDASGGNQQEINDKYNKFKQLEVGGIEQDLSQRARKEQYINDYATAQDAFNVKRNAATYSYIPNQTYQISGGLVLSGSHFIEGQGDYSVLKFSGTDNGISCIAGSKYDDHAKRTIQNIRIDGDRPSGTGTHGTTRGLYVSGHGHAGEVKGVTFNGHDVGYYLGLNYTSRGCYNMYRANRIGLHLHSVTSYREESIYARYNTEAAVLITGSNQNITFAGGAIEGNSGRAIWARDLVVNSNVQITLDDVYLEVNGDEALGIPSVELQEIEKMEVIVNGGSYWYNLNNGVYSGPYMWGNSVSFHGSSLQGYHYAKKISLNNVLQAPIMNTAKVLTIARAFGLREPAIVSVFTPQTFSPTVFQIPFVTGKPPKIIGHTNNAIQTYPFSSLGGGVTRSEDTINDYGDGKLEKLSFSATGNYNSTYATLFTTAHSANNMSVYVFALVPEADCEIGLIAADSATRDISYFSLKGGVKYKFVRTFYGLAGTTERFRMFSINGACSVSFKPIAVYQFNDNDTSNAFIKSLSTPAEKFTPAANQADSVATDVVGLKADFNALLAKLKTSGQML